jgi:hypothetical protein
MSILLDNRSQLPKWAIRRKQLFLLNWVYLLFFLYHQFIVRRKKRNDFCRERWWNKRRREERLDDGETTVDVWVKIALCECERTHCTSYYKRPKAKKSRTHMHLHRFVVPDFFFLLLFFLTYSFSLLYSEKTEVCVIIYD